MRRALQAFALLVLSASALATDSAQRVSVTGLFSDLRYIPQAGDLLGYEVFIIFGGDAGHFALVQCAEGFPSKPVLVPVKVRGATVQFTIEPTESSHCPAASFTGTVSPASLTGKFVGTTEIAVSLPRKPSYWQ